MHPGSFLPLWPALLFALFLSACAPLPPPVSGVLKGEVVWRGTVKLSGDVILAPESRLTIAPGTTVLFLPPGEGEDHLIDHPHFRGSELIIRGTVFAEGKADAPIVFRYVDPSAPAGSWGGINLQQSTSAVFRHCLFTQADSALHSQESRLTVTESLFEGNLVALRFHTSAVLFEHNLVRRNGTGIRFHFGSPVIRWNDILDNDKAFFITSHPQEISIEKNNILNSREFSVVLGEEVPEGVPMRQNWWGKLDPEEIAASFYDGRRVDYLGRIELEPPAAARIPGAGVSWGR